MGNKLIYGGFVELSDLKPPPKMSPIYEVPHDFVIESCTLEDIFGDAADNEAPAAMKKPKKQPSYNGPHEFVCGICGVKRGNVRAWVRVGGVRKIFCPVCKAITEHTRVD